MWHRLSLWYSDSNMYKSKFKIEELWFYGFKDLVPGPMFK